MSTPNPGRASQAERRTVTLRRDRAERFRATCKERGHVGSTLIYAALGVAVVRARQGLPLPRAGSEPSAGADRQGLLWTQSKPEYVEWEAELDRAGSSVKDVIGAFAERYSDTAGDFVAALEGWESAQLPLAS